MTDMHVSVDCCYFGQLLDDGHSDLLEEPAERYEAH